MTDTSDLGPLSIVVIDIGNTNTGIARWVEGNVEDTRRVTTGDTTELVSALDEVRSLCENQERQAIVISSVVPEAAEYLASHIEQELDLRPFIVGQNTPLPVETAIEKSESVGIDRVCAAAAAFSRTEHACVVVQIGSAITIDLIDDDGVFQGGVIFPGMQLQASVLEEKTAQLPNVELTVNASVIGKNTEQAIQNGIVCGVAGAIRGVVEAIASERNQWPQVVMTGGGCQFLKEKLDFIDSWVPDLCLMGVGLSYIKRMSQIHGASE